MLRALARRASLQDWPIRAEAGTPLKQYPVLLAEIRQAEALEEDAAFVWDKRHT